MEEKTNEMNKTKNKKIMNVGDRVWRCLLVVQLYQELVERGRRGQQGDYVW